MSRRSQVVLMSRNNEFWKLILPSTSIRTRILSSLASTSWYGSSTPKSLVSDHCKQYLCKASASTASGLSRERISRLDMCLDSWLDRYILKFCSAWYAFRCGPWHQAWPRWDSLIPVPACESHHIMRYGCFRNRLTVKTPLQREARTWLDRTTIHANCVRLDRAPSGVWWE